MYVCPIEWDDLESTDSSDIKFCDVCNENVYWTKTQEEFEKFASEGKCVAHESDEITLLGIPDGSDDEYLLPENK